MKKYLVAAALCAASVGALADSESFEMISSTLGFQVGTLTLAYPSNEAEFLFTYPYPGAKVLGDVGSFSILGMANNRITGAEGTIVDDSFMGYGSPALVIFKFSYNATNLGNSAFTFYEVFGNTVVSDSGTLVAAAVPEPGTYALLLAGLGLLYWRHKDRTVTQASLSQSWQAS